MQSLNMKALLGDLKGLPVLLLGILPISLLAYLVAWQLSPADFGQIGFGITIAYLVLLTALWLPFGFWLLPALRKARPNPTYRQVEAARFYLCFALLASALTATGFIPSDQYLWRSVAIVLGLVCALMLGFSYSSRKNSSVKG